jgi:hypothetical protein
MLYLDPCAFEIHLVIHPNPFLEKVPEFGVFCNLEVLLPGVGDVPPAKQYKRTVVGMASIDLGIVKVSHDVSWDNQRILSVSQL